MKNPDLTYHTLCRLLAARACVEFHRGACPEPFGYAQDRLSRGADMAPTSTLGSDDWRLLAATARREGVAPLLYHTLKKQRLFGISQGHSVESSQGAGEISPQPLSPSTSLPRVRSPGKSLKMLSAPVPGGVASEATLQEPPRGRGFEHFPGKPRVPAAVQANLRQAYYAATVRNFLIYRELSRILTALNTQYPIPNTQPPIPVILLKGAALAATLYPSIGLRTMGDLDLLVPQDRLVEAVACLKALGYVEPYPEMAAGLNALVGHHVHLRSSQNIPLAVELHWTLVSNEHDSRAPSLPWFWQQTEQWKMEKGEISNTQSPTSNPSTTLRTGLQPPFSNSRPRPISSTSAPT
jgi:hypothetical protein